MAKMNARQIIEMHGAEVKKRYTLVNNWGYIITYKGARYDVRRWRNCYGSDCGWGVWWDRDQDGTFTEQEWCEDLERELNDYEVNNEW